MTGAVLTAGETMAMFDPLDGGGPPRYALRAAGAESNFAIALTRLGVEARWVSRLGADALGAYVRAQLEDGGLDLRWTATDDEAPTGLFVKARTGGRTEVAYYRAGSAASRMDPGDLPDDALDGVELVHLTGITTALSPGCAELVLELARRGRERGALVQFDPNYRPQLWPSPAAAGDAQRPLLGLCDWYLCGAGEAAELLGADEDELVPALRRAGVERAVVRRGAGAALLVTPDGETEVAPARVEAVVDEVGAGDAFAAGFAFGLLRGWEPERCVRAAHVIAAHALRGTGDWETLPRLDDVAAELGLVS
jgi:2-dehydro-3-deoxygluconokinase